MSPSPAVIPRTAWLLVLFLMPVALLNYLDRQMLASMRGSVMADIPTLGEPDNRDELWGIMLGQFKWVYAVFSLVGGYVADRFSRRFTICASLFVWSAVTWWTGQVSTYTGLLWARSFMGVSEAFYIPAALALITDCHPDRTRSRAVGMHQTAIYLGVIAGGFGGYAADLTAMTVQFVSREGAAQSFAIGLGWRAAFSACGVIGMAYAVPLVFLLRNGGRADETGKARRVSVIAAVPELLTNWSFLLLVVYFTLPAMAAWVVRDWMPAILKTQFDIGQGLAGVSATLYWQLAAVIGVAGGGWLADRWVRTTPRGRLYVSAAGTGLIVLAIFGVGNAGSLATAVAFLIVFGIGWGFFDGNNMPILSQVVRPHLRATGYGVMNFVSISCGGLADWGFGLLRSNRIPLNVSFSLFAALAVISIVLVLLIRPKPELTTQEPRS